MLPVPWHDSLREALFCALHRIRRCPHLGLAHEQVKVLGHDHVPEHSKAMLLAHFLENSQKQITPLGGIEPGLPLRATASDEVQISYAVMSLQTVGIKGD
jgi:hypothetical protein